MGTADLIYFLFIYFIRSRQVTWRQLCDYVSSWFLVF